MNTTIANQTWKRINKHYVVAVCGLPLAAVIATGGYSLGGNHFPGVSPLSNPVVIPAFAAGQSASTETLYVVGSQDAANLLVDELRNNQSYSVLVLGLSQNFSVYVAGTPAQEAVARHLIREKPLGIDFQVVDLRTGLPSAYD
jgi:hypothetical protein